MPDEIEVTVTDARDIGHDYSGTYALSRLGVFQGQLFGGNGWFFSGTPFDESANPPIPAIRIALLLGTCSVQGFVNFEPEDWTIGGGGICDDCHLKCRFTAQVTISDVGNLFSALASTFFQDESKCVDEQGYQVDPCSVCEETPICDPSGRSLSLCSQQDTGGPFLECICGEMTIDT